MIIFPLPLLEGQKTPMEGPTSLPKPVGGQADVTTLCTVTCDSGINLIKTLPPHPLFTEQVVNTVQGPEVEATLD